MKAHHEYTEGQILAMLHLAKVSGIRAEQSLLDEQSVYVDPPDASLGLASLRHHGDALPMFRIPSRRGSRG